MGQALYRKYRSKSLDEIVGQEHITQTLSEALKQDKVSHAYLFTGPRGVGKTSIARIWAHEINGLPYTDDSSHLDIIEIDAASNRRIDEIRDLREKVHVAPSSAKYKVYIIDEVHMLTREAFNALLKTLEEPPAHAVFILATTDAHKLPETIISRTQRYTFRPVDADKVIGHLQHIAETEQITVDEAALQLLAEHGEGSFRDSISLLDQAAGQGKPITKDMVESLLGLPPAPVITALLHMVTNGSDSAQLVTTLDGLYGQGFQAATIARMLGAQVRSELINGTSLSSDTALKLLQSLLEVPMAYNPERYLEICLLQQLQPQPAAAAPVVAPRPEPITVEKPQPKAAAEKPAPPKAAEPDKPAPAEKPAPKPKASTPKAVTTGSSSFNEAIWPDILQELKQKHNTLYGIIRMATPTFSDEGLRLAFNFAFHQKRVNEAASREKLSAIISGLTGQDVTIECVVEKADSTDAKLDAKAANQDLSSVSNIFGGGELLES